MSKAPRRPVEKQNRQSIQSKHARGVTGRERSSRRVTLQTAWSSR